MYRVLIRQGWDGEETVIHSSRVNNVKLEAAKITKDVKAIDSFAFTIYPGNPGFDALKYLTTFVRVYNTRQGRNEFDGRVLMPSEPIDSGGLMHKDVTCEGLLAFTQDTAQPFQEFSNQSKSTIFQALIANHNALVDDYKQLKIGNVKFTDDSPIEYVATDETKSTYDNLQDMLVTPYGGELQVRHEADGLYIDCLPLIGGEGKQVIQLKRNLLSITQTVDPSALVTMLKPLGNTVNTTETDNNESTAETGQNQGYYDDQGLWHDGGSSSSGGSGYYDDQGYWHDMQSTTSTASTPPPATTEASGPTKATPRVTIASVNGGSPYIRDEDLIKLYGVIQHTQTFDSSDPATIMQMGRDYMTAQGVGKLQIQVKAVDLSLVDQSIDDFKCGWAYPISVPLQDIDSTLRIVQQELDLNDPTQDTMTIGDRVVGQEELSRIEATQSSQSLRTSIVVQGQQVADHSQKLIKLNGLVETNATDYSTLIKKLQDGTLTGGKGPKGDTGPQGVAGPKGDTGATGPAGPIGPAGPKGDTGAAGKDGAQGSQGVPGKDGAAGPKGDKGDPGSVGAQGPAGPQGADGKNATPNYVQKSEFSDGSRGAWNGDSMVVPVTGQAFTAALKVDGRDTDTSDAAERFPVSEGEVWHAIADVNTQAAKVNFAFGLHFIKSDGTHVWTALITQTPGQDWQHLSGDVVISDSMLQTASPWLQLDGAVGTDLGNALVTNLSLTRQLKGPQVNPGANGATGAQGPAGAIYTQLGENTDINDVNGAGFYGCPWDSMVATMKNVPQPNAFGMIVIPAAGGPIQIFNAYMLTGARIYRRSEYQGTYGPWHEILQTDLDTIISANYTFTQTPMVAGYPVSTITDAATKTALQQIAG